MIRLKDIAERAGVSVMTVSKVLRDAPDISVATKVRIRQLAEQLGYVPDSVAQGLRTRTTRLFGVVVPGVVQTLSAHFLLTLEERAHELGYELILAQTFNLPEREEAVIRRLLSRRVDGLFIVPVYRFGPSAPIYMELTRRGTPTVLFGHRAPFCAQFANVETDDALASHALTNHLIQLGHREIAFFAGPPAAPWAQERMEGYRRALREAQIPVEDRLIFSAGTTIEEGEKAALQMVNEGTRSTALQAVNDLVAIGAANVLLSQGLRIPHDVSLVGFDNTLTSEHFRVPLTTVCQPRSRLANEAMDSMLKLLARHKPESKRFQGEIIVRASTAAPVTRV
jgi:LacI family repressor for deo operon, udp, cdd, tsx, nupC, and nupG